LRGLGAPSTPVLLILVLFGAVVVTHQLTPYIAVVLFAGLAVFCRARPRWLPVAMLAMALGWLFLARGYLLDHPELLGLNPNVAANAAGVSAQQAVDPPPASVLIATAARALSLLVWALALVGAAVAWRGRRVDRRVLLLAGAPFSIVLANGYGGEAVYRVFLFSLPGMAVLAAGALFGDGARWARFALGTAVSLLLSGLFVVAYFGRDLVNEMGPREPELVAWVDREAPAGSIVAVAFPNLPAPLGGEYSQLVAAPYGLTALPPRNAERPTYTAAEFCDAAWGWLDVSPNGSAYLIVSSSQVRYARASGYAPDLTFEELRSAIEACGAYEMRFRNEAGAVWQVIGFEPARRR
jgi:hypothetical protein